MVNHFFLTAIRTAQAITKEFYINDPSHIELELICVTRGVWPEQSSLQGCDARLLLDLRRSRGIATVSSQIPEPGRKRFALAHELGHFELHRRRKQAWACTGDDFLKWYLSNDAEPEANAFAAELLMPQEVFQKHCVGMKSGFRSVSELTEVFKTSLTSTAIRYTEIGNFPCALISSHDGKISWFRASHDFRFRIRSVSSKLDPYSCAGDYFFKGTTLPDRPERVDAFCWLENSGPSDRTILYEEAIAMPKYGTVLSLIWSE